VVGGGFGGLQTVRALRRAPVDVTLVDRNNYHLFQPLSYQVATGALSPEEIAVPLRRIFGGVPNVRVLMAEVAGMDLEAQTVLLQPRVAGPEEQTVPYDTLVVAAGSSYSYFGHDEWRPLALEVKSLNSALRVRSRILAAFEAAELDVRADERASWLTFVVVGAGPTGVEMAGQIAELARQTLADDFREIQPADARILLVEGADRVLPAFSERSSANAVRSLETLGVTPLVKTPVVAIQPGGVDITKPDGSVEHVPARTVIWAAGVTASPLARMLADASGSDVDHAGRVAVEPDLTLPGHPSVLAVGDMTRIRDARTGEVRVLPGLAPVAMQQGRYAGRLISDRVAGRQTHPFHYRDKGNLATIGRARAVAELKGLRFSGFPAWALWLLVHIYYLIGFENRLVVLVRWAYNFFTRGRGARVITEVTE
jgi:NADH dehydrogenase